jgi:hypothetical protein
MLLAGRLALEGQWPRDAYSGRNLTTDEFTHPPETQILVRGWFQRFEYIADIRDAVREDWCRPDVSLPARPAGDFLICVRLTDYMQDASALNPEDAVWANSTLREAEIRHLAKIVRHERLYFVTDEPRHPLWERLRDWPIGFHRKKTPSPPC